MSFLRLPFRKFVLAMTIANSILSCIEANAAGLRLTWSDVSTNETGFKIERMSGSNSYAQIATVLANVSTYTDNTVTLGANYCYRVRAFNTAGNSEYSNAGCATAISTSTSPSGSPSAPPASSSTPTSSPTVSSGTITRLTSKWNDYRVTMKIQSQDNDRFGAMFRYQDHQNYYRFSWSPESRRLEKRVDGTTKVLKQDTVAYNVGQTYALQIIAQGSSLKVLIDGKTIFSVSDSSFSDGTIALYSYYNEGSSFDDVLVEELPSSKILLSDNFNDRNHVGWTIIDEIDQAMPSNWSAATGAFVQSNNMSTYALFTRGSWQDYRVSLKIRSNDDDSIGVLFRFHDNENYYRFSWARDNAGRQLAKREQGITKIIARDTVPYVIGKIYLVEIIAQGSSLKVNIDGKAVFSVTDQSFKNGTIALYSYYNQGSAFNDIRVEELPTQALLLWDDFNNNNFAGWTVFDQSGPSVPSAWSVVGGELVQSINTNTLLVY